MNKPKRWAQDSTSGHMFQVMKKCSNCKGEGYVWHVDYNNSQTAGDVSYKIPCPECNGTGYKEWGYIAKGGE